MMNDKQLLALLTEEEADAVSFYSSELAGKQTEAMKRYNVEPYGDEITGRSTVLTQDLADAMDWTLASFRRIFMNSVDLVALTANKPEDEKDVEGAATYLRHVFFQDNDGHTFIRTFAFDGLLQKIGVASIRWEDGQPEPQQELEGVLAEQLDRYVSDSEYEIVEQEEYEETVEGEPTRMWNLKVIRTRKGKCLIENVAPENFLVSRRAATLREANYRGVRTKEFLSDLKKLHPEKATALDPKETAAGDDEVEIDADPRREERFTDEPEDSFSADNNDINREEVTLHREYIRVDYDEDGTTELLYVSRVGNTILETMPVEDCEFAVWTPIPKAHAMIGKSLADRVIDIQKVRTVTTRNALDNLALSIRPRNVVNTNIVAEEWLDVVLDHQIGGIIPASGPAGEAVAPLAVPDMTDSAYKMLNYYDEQAERQTGITRHSVGLDPETLTQTKGGISMMQNAGGERKEDMASLLGTGLEDVFSKVLKVLCHNQDHSRIIKVQKQWVTFDPREWSDDMTVSVHVGQGVGSRETQVANLSLIASKQELLIGQVGPDNPISGLREYRNTMARMAEAMGFRNPTQFFKELPEEDPNAKPKPEQPDPEVIKAQSDANIAQQESQARIDLKKFEAAEKARLDEMRLQGDLANDARRIDGELDLKRGQLAGELDLAEEAMEEKAKLARANGSTGSVSKVHIGGEAG